MSFQQWRYFDSVTWICRGRMRHWHNCHHNASLDYLTRGDDGARTIFDRFLG
jgi:hypothetical protein